MSKIIDADWLTLTVEHLPTLYWMYSVLPKHVVERHDLLRAGRDILMVAPATGTVPESTLVDLATLVRSEVTPQSLAAATGRLAMLGHSGSHQAAHGLAVQLSAVVNHAEEQCSRDVADALPPLQLLWGIARQTAGDLPGSLTEFKVAYSGNSRLGLAGLARDAAGKAALTTALQGDLVEASSWLKREAKLPQPEDGGWLNEMAPVAGHVARAIVAMDRLDRNATKQALEKVQSLHPQDMYWPFVAAAVARSGLLFGPLAESLHQLQDQVTNHQGAVGDGIAGPMLLCAELDLLVALGQADRAIRLISESVYDSPRLTVISSRVHFLAGVDWELPASLDEILASPSSPRLRIEALLLRAAILARQSDQEGSRRLLADALAVSSRYGLLIPFAGVPREFLRSASSDLPALVEVVETLGRHQVREMFPESLELTPLTPRERVVLRELAAGGSPQQIAARLYVSLATLKSQRNTLYRKLGVHSRNDALQQAYARGLL